MPGVALPLVIFTSFLFAGSAFQLYNFCSHCVAAHCKNKVMIELATVAGVLAATVEWSTSAASDEVNRRLRIFTLP